jgi:hypothetical protein
MFSMSWTGILTGWNYYSNINNCSVQGTITAFNDTKRDNIGGISGRLSAGEISNCSSDVKIQTSSTFGTEACIGGIAGYMYGTVSSCSADVDIHYEGNNENTEIGGVAGFQANDGVKIENCSFKYEKGDTHPYYYGKIDLQPNMPELGVAPFKAGDLIYTEGADVTLNNEKINGSIR